jgi:ArsR family transcriptional regulator
MDTNSRLASQFQALADPIRLRIIQLVSQGSPSATDLNRALEMSQPRVAHHLKVLVDAALILARRDGRFVRYALPADPAEASIVQAALGVLGGQRGGRSRAAMPGADGGRSHLAAPPVAARQPETARPQPRPAWEAEALVPQARPPASSAGPSSRQAPADEVESEPERPEMEDFLL